jgi:CBS domain containing-hemolysin-like protein
MARWLEYAPQISLALFLVVINGFFVAAEFALVKIRRGRLDELVQQRRPFAKTARWLAERMNRSLSACQIGITMASLALGWVGEPAFVRVIEPVFRYLGVETGALLHTVSFIFAFSLITILHLVVGEQAPKIFAIRRAESMLLWCALPLKFFYVLLYPFLIALNWSTDVVLGWVGLDRGAEHHQALTESEIRTLLRESHVVGNLTGSEHRLLNAVFEFDDMICRRVMIPRVDIVWVDMNKPLSETMPVIQRTKHTRYPACEGSLDNIVGILHIKDLVGIDCDVEIDLRKLLRPPKTVPETMPISKLLQHFQATHQLMAFVVDEHGTLVGAVTLENVLEEIVGPVEDEFDTEPEEIVPAGRNKYIVFGSTSLAKVSRALGIDFSDEIAAHQDVDVDTLSGLLVAKMGRIVTAGDKILLADAEFEVLEDKHARATRVRVALPPDLTPKVDAR